MNFPELMFMAEAEGQLPTRMGRLNAIIKDIKNFPAPAIDSDILISTNDRFKCHGLDTIYRVRSMEERFKDQSIDKITLQNSANII